MVAVVADVGEVVVGDEGQDEEGGEYHGDELDGHVTLAPAPPRSQGGHAVWAQSNS